LQLFYSNPNRSFYVREITRKIDEQINSVRRELANLLNVGLITSDTSNNKVYYEVNQKYEFYPPLEEIFGAGTSRARKATKAAKAIELPLQDESADLKALGNVEVAALMGQFTRDESTGIDVLIVGNVNQNALAKYVTELERQEGKDLRYTVFSLDDFTYRLQIKDRFMDTVRRSKKQVLLDKPGLLS
jgi:hypothetical protein